MAAGGLAAGSDAETDNPPPELELLDWRRRVLELYAEVRAAADPEAGHGLWRAGRDWLFQHHSQSPLATADPLRRNGIPYWPYDPSQRFELPLLPNLEPAEVSMPTGGDGVTSMRRIGYIQVPPPFDATLDVWWLSHYAGGLFLPLRDGSAGETSYGGGRYLLDTAKGADLGASDDGLTVDLNFLYHPSCRYSSAWICPLAPAGNVVTAPINAGERL
jgi:uncharacterized protein (DUF1684 family)